MKKDLSMYALKIGVTIGILSVLPRDLRLCFYVISISMFVLSMLTKDVPLKPSGVDKLMLEQGGYDLKVLAAPSASGKLLTFFASAFTNFIVGPILRRILINGNGIHQLRELAAQIKKKYNLPYMYYPVMRLDAKEYEIMEQTASKHPLDVLLRNGFEGSRKTSSVYWTVEDYAKAYRQGEITPVEVITRVLEGVRKFQPTLKAFQSILEEEVMIAAKASAERFKQGCPLGVFDGVPIAVKDMIKVKGHKMTDGTALESDALPAEKDDILVHRFRVEQGAIIIGTTTMTEFGTSPLGWNSRYKGCRNPYNTSYYSGGSSSGSAVAVATGLVPVAIGFDGGGSIRIPACICGVFGLGATFSRIPFDGDNLGSTMIKSGPLAATARDAALAFAVMSPNYQNDHGTHFYSQLYGASGPPPPHLDAFEDTELKGVNLGVFWDFFEDADTETVAMCKCVVSFLEEKGATIVPISIPHISLLSLAHGFGISSEFSAAEDRGYHNHLSTFEAGTSIQLSLGRSMTAIELLSANRVRAWGFNFIEKLFKKKELSAIISPTIGVATPKLEKASESVGESNTALVMQIMKYIFLGNLIGLPGMSVPIGYSTQHGGTPIGMHLLGKHWGEAELLRIANIIEESFLKRSRPTQFFHNVFPEGSI